MTVLMVAVGAAVGAPLRYVADRLVRRRGDGVFPWGTLAVNVVGSFVLGALTGAAADGRLDDDVTALAGVGFCGALTTYSTFGYETLRLVEGGARWVALGNVGLSIGAGLLAVSAGWWLA